jgi:P4 family phage/plasmid primase-like protien
MDKKHKTQLARDLVEIHIPLERHVFPLSPCTKIPPKGLHWPTAQFTKAQLLNYISRGYNLAWAMGPQDVVLDVDPRKPAACGSFKKLGELGIAPDGWDDRTGIVNTGGADHGQHYYIRLPPNVKTETHHPDFPDLDFRRQGQYVVLPGSQHPDTRRYYQWDLFSRFEDLPMLMPPKLLDLLRINTKPKKEVRNGQDISIDELRHYLTQLGPQDFRTRQAWIELAFMVHSAIGEPGRELFFEWSAKDDLYGDCQDENEQIWDSIKDNKQNNLGFGSLVQKVLDCGGQPYRVPAAIEFDDGFDFNKSRLDEFVDKLAKAPPSTSDADAKAYVREAAKFGLAMWDRRLRREVSECLDLKTSTVDKFWRQIEREKERAQKDNETKKIDYPEVIACRILKDHFDNGKTLIHAINQRFYHYIDTHWAPLLDNEITKYLYDASKQIKRKNKASHEASKKIAPAMTAVIAKTAKVNDDVFDFAGRLKPIINCANGELHINVATGEVEFHEHNPKSYLLQCLKTPYDPQATCPVWDKTLRGIFRDHKDTEGMVRHLYEIFGYIIQPQKDIASWFLWLGGGNNGKSITLEVLQALMGEQCFLPRAIHDFDSPGKSNHAIASLVGKLAIVDDDANTEKPLPSSVLKKLAEGRVWEADPKYKDQFNFRSSATPIVLFNGWPKIKDITFGMLRKVFVIPFKRRFVEGVDEDKTIFSRVAESELPGILNRSLEGLKRLRQRGRFWPPQDCVDAKNGWLRQSNDVLNWLSEYCVSGNGAWTSVTQLYASYQIWADNNHRRNKQSIADLENHLLQRGMKLETRSGNRGFIGIEVK